MAGPSTWTHVFEQPRQNNRAAEHVAFVDEIGEPVRVFLGTELPSGALPFFIEDGQDPRSQRGEQIAIDQRFEHHVSMFVELPLFFGGHDVSRFAARGSPASNYRINCPPFTSIVFADDKAGGVGGEERNDIGALLRRADPAERDHTHERFHHLRVENAS
jgi:hypothetical protein